MKKAVLQFPGFMNATEAQRYDRSEELNGNKTKLLFRAVHTENRRQMIFLTETRQFFSFGGWQWAVNLSANP